MKNQGIPVLVITICLALAFAANASAQSRPRRVAPPPDTLLGPEPKPSPVANRSAPLLDVKPAKPVGNAPVSSDTNHAYQLLQEKKYAEASKEAKQIASADPSNAEAWKI